MGDQNFVKLELRTAWYFKGFGQGHVLELGGNAGVAQKLNSQDVPFYDRYYLGGQGTLRGFDYHGVGPRQVSQDGHLYEPIGGDTYWFGFHGMMQHTDCRPITVCYVLRYRECFRAAVEQPRL